MCVTILIEEMCKPEQWIAVEEFEGLIVCLLLGGEGFCSVEANAGLLTNFEAMGLLQKRGADKGFGAANGLSAAEIKVRSLSPTHTYTQAYGIVTFTKISQRGIAKGKLG